MKLKVYIATGNRSKLADFKQLISWIDSNIVVELVPNYIEIEEKAKTLAGNSRLKVTPYLKKYKFPVIANDSGLTFDRRVIEIQDSTKVKRNALNGKQEALLTQEEIGQLMFEYYRSIAKKYGGKIDCIMYDAFTILHPNGEIRQSEAARAYKLIDRDVSRFDIYHPLNSLRISPRIGKYMDEMNEEETKIDKEALILVLKKLLAT